MSMTNGPSEAQRPSEARRDESRDNRDCDTLVFDEDRESKIVKPTNLPVANRQRPTSSELFRSRTTRYGQIRQMPSTAEIARVVAQGSASNQLFLVPCEAVLTKRRGRGAGLGKALGKALFTLCSEPIRASRLQEMRDMNELKAQLTELVSENHGDTSLVSAMAVAVRELRMLQGDFGPAISDLSTQLTFSDASSDNQMFCVSVVGYDIRAVTPEALSNAQAACQHHIANRTLTCKCEIRSPGAVALTVKSTATLEEPEEGETG